MSADCPKLPLPSVQDLFDQSFNASRVKLRKAPPVLILQMPRFDNALNLFQVDSSLFGFKFNKVPLSSLS